MLDTLATWAQDVILELGYPGIFALMLVETLFPPIPSEVVLPFSGWLSSRGEFSLAAVVAIGTLGNVVGAWLLYGLGRWGDERVRAGIRRWGRYAMVSERDLDSAERMFRRHGGPITFFSRMIPGIRSLISIPAGMARMNFWKFTAFTVLGSLVWAFALAYAGYQLGENWEDIVPIFDRLGKLILAVCVLAVVAYFVYRIRSRRRAVEPVGD